MNVAAPRSSAQLSSDTSAVPFVRKTYVEAERIVSDSPIYLVDNFPVTSRGEQAFCRMITDGAQVQSNNK